MKPNSLKRIILFVTTLIILTPLTVLYSFKTKLESYSDIWQQLGISEKDGSGKIRESFLYGYLQYYGVRNFKNIALGDRKSITTDLLTYTKNYVQSGDFKKVYEAERQNRKPRQTTRQVRTEDQIRQELLKSTKESMADAEKNLKTATGDLKKIYQDGYDMLKKQFEDYQRPDNEMIPLMAQGEKMQVDNELKQYAEDLKNWELNYPAESSRFIKKRLQEVLNATAGIDYTAQLIDKNNKKYFVKQEYERKPSNWKAGFRAGKEVTETVRTFLQQWIQELN